MVYAGSCTLWVACWFYSSLHLQTLFSALWSQPASFAAAAADNLRSEWSAPLDDVFIHFDFARATAEGYPFQWYPGNGYSSGGTSPLYPLVLAIGYALGFSGLKIMHWAGVVACVCVLATLLAARRLFSSLPVWSSYLAPPALLGIGALSWSLFSGMEVALFLAFWGGGFVAYRKLRSLARSEHSSHRSVASAALALGGWGALLVATRPEGAVCVAVFGLFAAYPLGRKSFRTALMVVAAVAAPALLVLVTQALANRVLTGDYSAAGALSKLEIYHPYLTAGQVFDAWVFHIKYQILRITQYHFTDVPAFGWIAWLFAGLALVFPKTRRDAAILWASAAGWVFVVALNGQVRWQNERYTMPAVAFLMLAAAMGVAATLSYNYERLFKARGVRAAIYLGSLSAVLAFAWHQAPRFVEQVWFFGRASRNIHDQHVRAGRLLKDKLRARRVLLSDAGAIVYASNLPAIDLIGLGGFEGLPFARAGRLGAGAALELIERLPEAERPDVMALYPSWWGTLPLWFGDIITQVPVRGNVICGGISKVLYRADWRPFDRSATPVDVFKGRIVDTLDFADVVSEKAHGFELSRRGVGYVVMSMTAQPPDKGQIWDAGRVFAPGYTASFVLRKLTESHPLTLRFRSAQLAGSRLRVRANGRELLLSGPTAEGFSEVEVTLPPEAVTRQLEITLEASTKTIALYHLWALQ